MPRALVGLAAAIVLSVSAARADRDNPLVMQMPDGRPVENCADPTVIRGQQGGDTSWYMYCTKDALFDGDVSHRLPMFRSEDLVHWTYAGDALAAHPFWAQSGAHLWAPEIAFFRGKYHLYYAVTDTKDSISGEPGCAWDAAIGVASSSSPTGPFEDSGAPVVAPRRKGAGCTFALTIDPDVITDATGQKRIYYGNFNGGIEVRELSSDGRSSSPESAVPVVIADRAEAPEVVLRDGVYWLFASVASCCDGPRSGYAVIVGRSTSPTGPFVDRQGMSLLAGRSGGTIVLASNGTRWVGPGHNTVLRDLSGQDWTIYHAIDLEEPYFAGAVGYTKRPAFLDPLDWIDGWPAVRGGWWVSDCAQAEPVAQEGGTPTHVARRRAPEQPGPRLPEFSDEFDGPELGPQWSWIRQPASGYGLGAGSFRLDTRAAELHLDSDTAPVLVEPAPAGDFLAETRMRLSVPAEGGAFNYVQAGLVVHGDDDNYVKLVHAAIGVTRQTEFAIETTPVPEGYPRYGKSFVGPPGEWTWLRIVRRATFGGELYTALTSLDGITWSRGATWKHALGPGARIGLVAMNRAGYTAEFDFLRVFELAAPDCVDPALADPCDVDGDTIGDLCDADDDADLLDDVADCAPDDAEQGRPDEVPQIRVMGPSPTLLSWDATARADAYDVVRGSTAGLPAGDYGTCLADDLAATSLEDDVLPAPGEAFTYLVRGDDAGCGGGGSWGANANPTSCP